MGGGGEQREGGHVRVVGADPGRDGRAGGGGEGEQAEASDFPVADKGGDRSAGAEAEA